MKPIDKAVEILGGTARAAEKLLVTYQTVKNWQDGTRTPQFKDCAAIELATESAVVCEELNQDLARPLEIVLGLRKAA